jgi:hypothetical protein
MTKEDEMIVRITELEMMMNAHSSILLENQRRTEIILGKYEELSTNYSNLVKEIDQLKLKVTVPEGTVQ